MRELLIVCRNVAPGRVIGAHGLGITRLDTVILRVWRIRIDGIDRLFDTPPTTRHDDRILDNVAGFQSDLVSVLVFPLAVSLNGLKQKLSPTFRSTKANCREITFRALCELAVFDARARGKSGSDQRRAIANGAMTIDAADFDRSARFVIKNSVTVRVLTKVAIDALHALL